jgi:thymidylate kinase
MFVSFSGIDGAGKSTQIEKLRALFEFSGMRVVLVTFWDDVARLTHLRETTGHAVFKGDKGVGTPAAPINRRDKNVRSRLMTIIRLFLYFIDALSLRSVVRKALRSNADLVIFDRYTYDELSNLELSNPAIRVYVRLIMKIVPEPDISFLLDADPVLARARKPEYPLAFLHASRGSYLTLSAMTGRLTVVPALTVDEVERVILGHVSKKFSKVQNDEAKQSSGNDCDFPAAEQQNTRPATS